MKNNNFFNELKVKFDTNSNAKQYKRCYLNITKL